MYICMRFPLNAALILALCFSFTTSVVSTKRPTSQPIGLNQKLDATQSYAAAGQSETLLPDGRLLLVGGEGPEGPMATISVKDPQTGTVTTVPERLLHARAWHTATLLPDGIVFIFGGVGADGHVLEGAELFDTFTNRLSVISAPALIGRAHHTTTVLTDGELLFVGGTSVSGDILSTTQLWDYYSSNATRTIPQQSPRKDHRATLQGDGTVLISGGTNQLTGAVTFSELYDPIRRSFTISTQQAPAQDSGGAPELIAAIPEDRSEDVAVGAVVALRFSRPLNVATVNTRTVVLSDQNGPVPVKVVGLERGILAFLTPVTKLNQGITYTVTASGPADWNGVPLTSTSVSFTTVRPPNAPPNESPSTSGDFWSPSTQANQGKSGQGNSPNQSFPALQAKPGETALAGQVLRLSGEPLAGVTLSIDTTETKTDLTGRFLLTAISPGHHAMLIDGSTANKKGHSYGVFEVGIDVAAGKTTVLKYTIWMTGLDIAHAVAIPSPTISEVVVKTPLLPGLELHIPPGTTITDRNGLPVTKISITPIPIDQPPFPLPRGVLVPTYFTIQPGSAYIHVQNPLGPQGAQLYYPNPYHFPSGTVFSFYNYDPDQKGWYVYGQGKVDKDARQVVPAAGTAIYEFTGAMVSQPSNAPPMGPKRGNPKRADPVDLQTGLFVNTKTDLALPDVIPLSLTRVYRQGDFISRAFGIGATHPYDMFMVGDNETFPEGYTFQELVLADGGRIHFARTSPCNGDGYCNFANAVYSVSSTPGEFYGAILQFVADDDVWTITRKDGTVYTFPDSDAATVPQYAALIGVTDRYGNSLTLTRDGASNLTKVTSPNGRWIQFTYDSSNRITLAQDNTGRVVHYSYDSSGRLSAVTDANGGVTNYTYDSSNEMVTITDARNITYLKNDYDSNGRLVKQTDADTGVFQFAYTLDSNGNVAMTTVTDARGIVEQVAFNSDGYMSSDTKALGRTEQQRTTYARQAGSGLLLGTTDSLGRQTSFTYDSNGNLTSATRLAGTSNAVTATFAYEPKFNRLTAIADPLHHIVNFGYDNNGNLLSLTNAIGNTTSFTYNTQGQLTSTVDPLGNTNRFTYSTSGDLVGITDSLGRIQSRSVDPGGRVVSVTDPNGNSVKYGYNPFNQITSVTGPEGNQTSFGYDGNGNLASVTDGNGHATQYTYNNKDLIATRKDALLNQDVYQYDASGNLTQFTDRRGKVTTYAYDALNRRTFAGFGTQPGATYESTITYAYDSVDRLNTIVDSVSGTTTDTLDGLDRLTSEVTPQGTVSYTYDVASRRATMTEPGSSTVQYTFDDADRITQILQGTTTVSFGYDAANRRTSLTLPGGVVANYSYDSASELVGITYVAGGSFLGNLSYSYDMNGRPTIVGGTFARTVLPLAVSQTSYNANNQLTTWGTANLFYDANGNMTSDGSHGYAWDARNRLSTIDLGSTASFSYDSFGRRTSKQILGTQTGFLYDGANPIQELSGTTMTASLLSGGLDEYFNRTDSGGSRTFLTDSLGSSIALADSTGAIQTNYAYGAFGNTSSSGATTSNSFQYTGRELDANGLYFYRARFYNPVLQRFISEDPLRFGGGDVNLYSYAMNNPVSLTDPTGQIIVIQGGYPGNISNYITAINYLSQDPGMAFIISNLELSSTVFTIDFNNHDDDSFDPATNTINWDPHSGCDVSSEDGTQSPALGLGHEMAHAEHGLENPWLRRVLSQIKMFAGRKDNLEEARTISGPERTAARTLGEPDRSDHQCTNTPKLPNPTLHTLITYPPYVPPHEMVH